MPIREWWGVRDARTIFGLHGHCRCLLGLVVFHGRGRRSLLGTGARELSEAIATNRLQKRFVTSRTTLIPRKLADRNAEARVNLGHHAAFWVTFDDVVPHTQPVDSRKGQVVAVQL
jgi:hypothetical protein